MKVIATHQGRSTLAIFETREEIEAHDLETLRAWLKTNDSDGDWDDDPDPHFGWVLTHEEAVDLIWESCCDFWGNP